MSKLKKTKFNEKVYQKAYREAHKIKAKKYHKSYYKNNKKELKKKRKLYRASIKDIIRSKNREAYLNNKEHRLIYAKKYRKTNSKNVKIAIKKWRKLNPKYGSENEKKRKSVDMLFKASRAIRGAIKSSFRNNGTSKNTKTAKILGCSFIEFKNYIESKFEPWMNWDNYGNKNGYPTGINQSWDLDHKIPTSSALNVEDLVRLNHYTNFQPLCSYTNRHIKSNHILIDLT